MPQDSTEISADLFGYMREEFYRVNGYPLVICTAEAGDVSTRYTRKGHGTAEIERVGNALVDEFKYNHRASFYGRFFIENVNLFVSIRPQRRYIFKKVCNN